MAANTHFADDTAPYELVHESDVPKAASSVLVVDDEAVVRDFLTRCLKQRGYVVKNAANAAEAIEFMVEQPASVLLCDIRMPGHDGLWLADRVRAHWPNTRVVMVTGIDDADTVRQSRESGAFDFITKPILSDQLLQVVGRAVASVPSEKDVLSEEGASLRAETQALRETRFDAEYTLESPVRCPACGERIVTLKAVRLVRVHVNFTSTLPRRGRVIACPHCLAVIPGELTNF